MSSRIPALPPLSSVKDEATRRVLEAIYAQLRVRNGETKNSADRFLTVGDLDQLQVADGKVKMGR